MKIRFFCLLSHSMINDVPPKDLIQTFREVVKNGYFTVGLTVSMDIVDDKENKEDKTREWLT